MVNSRSVIKFDEERFSQNTAWMKKGGEHFEVVIEPDNALEFRYSKGAHPDIKDCLHAERVFNDAKRGTHAKDETLTALFGTSDPLELAKRFIIDGTLQLTTEHRAKMREAKRNSIITRIQAYAIDPTTGLPHPETRIRLAIDEANVKIDDSKDAEEQIPGIVRQLQPILPIRLETVMLQLHLPAPYGQKLYGEIGRFGTVKKADWLSDGSLVCQLEMPAGLQGDLYDDLGHKTHGAAEIKKVGEERT